MKLTGRWSCLRRLDVESRFLAERGRALDSDCDLWRGMVICSQIYLLSIKHVSSLNYVPRVLTVTISNNPPVFKIYNHDGMAVK